MDVDTREKGQSKGSKAPESVQQVSDVLMDDNPKDKSCIPDKDCTVVQSNINNVNGMYRTHSPQACVTPLKDLHAVKRTTKDLYQPTVLCDYGGDLFKHEKLKLRQLDIHNKDDMLITSDEWYSALRPGTLVMVRATMHTFNWESHQVSSCRLASYPQ